MDPASLSIRPTRTLPTNNSIDRLISTKTQPHATHTHRGTTHHSAIMVCEDKRRIIAYLWYLNALLSVAYVIVAICAAANQKDVSTTLHDAVSTYAMGGRI